MNEVIKYDGGELRLLMDLRPGDNCCSRKYTFGLDYWSTPWQSLLRHVSELPWESMFWKLLRPPYCSSREIVDRVANSWGTIADQKQKGTKNQNSRGQKKLRSSPPPPPLTILVPGRRMGLKLDWNISWIARVHLPPPLISVLFIHQARYTFLYCRNS